MTPTWQQLQTRKCFAQLRESSVRDHMPFLMIIFHEDIKSTVDESSATFENADYQLSCSYTCPDVLATCSYVHT